MEGADGRRAVDRSDELWELIEPLLPKKKRRFCYPGRKRLPDRQALQGILFVLHTGVAWQYLPGELGFGSGVTCWRRPDEWLRAGVWGRLHELLLTWLRAAGEIEWARTIVDSSRVQAKKGAPRRGRARSAGAVPAPSTISSLTSRGSRSPSRSPGRTATTSLS
jgi:transposase